MLEQNENRTNQETVWLVNDWFYGILSSGRVKGLSSFFFIFLPGQSKQGGAGARRPGYHLPGL